MLRGTMWNQVKDQTSEMPLSLALHSAAVISLFTSKHKYTKKHLSNQSDAGMYRGLFDRQQPFGGVSGDAPRDWPRLRVSWSWSCDWLTWRKFVSRRVNKVKTFPFALVTWFLEANDTKMSFLFAWTLLCLLACCDIGECRRRNVLLIIGVQ